VINKQTIEQALDRHWAGTTLVREPSPLGGGFWAAMYRLELRGQPAGVPAQVVLRVAPDSAMGAKEAAVQQAVGEQGYPTPRVRLAPRDDVTLGGSWSITDFVAGKPPLEGLDGAAALRRVPSLLRAMPDQLARVMAQLHALDPGPATRAVHTAAPSVSWTIDDLLPGFERGALALNRHDLVDAVRALAERRPAERDTVICHGDLHPFNLLVDPAQHVTVIDWTGALRAEPAFDVAFTALLLANPPLDARGLLARVVGPVGNAIARRFRSRYRRANPGARLEDLGWYRALHGVRILIEDASLTAQHGDGANGHPFQSLAPAATSAVRAATGAGLVAPA
jgi:aminoglycoside phosphotransferase (APT) family kinase protein